MGLLPPNLSKEIRNKFKTIREETHKTLFIDTLPQKADCPNCLSDYNGASTNVFDSTFVSPVEIFGSTITPTNFTRGRCPVCYGNGQLEQEVRKRIKAIVRWNPSGQDSKGDLEKTPAGIEGFNVVQIKSSVEHYDTLRDAVKATIDGIECEVLLPPVHRGVGGVDVVVVCYFVSTQVGHSSRS